MITADDYETIYHTIFEFIYDSYDDQADTDIDDYKEQVIEFFMEEFGEDLRETIEDIVEEYFDLLESIECENLHLFYSEPRDDSRDDCSNDCSEECSSEEPITHLDLDDTDNPLVNPTIVQEHSEECSPTPLIASIIEELRTRYQPPQNTDEWYRYRHTMITASSAWKPLKSQAQQNSLIYEKCKPYQQIEGRARVEGTTDPREHGHKYEPISIQLYEERNGVKVETFGCLKHRDYEFIGASPDGIVTWPTDSPKYGTMLEIKNVVSREITGIPKPEYAVQMQLQLEVCNLDHCDFLETKFIEVSETEFCRREGVKGIILTGQNPAHEVKYYYYPSRTDFSPESVSAWTRHIQLANQVVYYQLTYWVLDQYSCIPFERDRPWFLCEALPKLQETWQLICAEKETGYQHRKPKPRTSSKNPYECVIKMNHEDEEK